MNSDEEQPENSDEEEVTNYEKENEEEEKENEEVEMESDEEETGNDEEVKNDKGIRIVYYYPAMSSQFLTINKFIFMKDISSVWIKYLRKLEFCKCFLKEHVKMVINNGENKKERREEGKKENEKLRRYSDSFIQTNIRSRKLMN